MHLCVCALNVRIHNLNNHYGWNCANRFWKCFYTVRIFVPENDHIFSSVFLDSDFSLALSTWCQFISCCSSQCMTKQYVNACLVSPRSHLLAFNKSKLYPCSTLFEFEDGTLMKLLANEWGCFSFWIFFFFFLVLGKALKVPISSCTIIHWRPLSLNQHCTDAIFKITVKALVDSHISISQCEERTRSACKPLHVLLKKQLACVSRIWTWIELECVCLSLTIQTVNSLTQTTIREIYCI